MKTRSTPSGTTKRGKLRGLVFASAFIALAAAGLSLRAPKEEAKPNALASVSTAENAAHAPASPVSSVPTFDDAVADLKKKKDLTTILADAEPGSWSRRAAVASLAMGYAQLTGDYDNYAAADKALDQAFAIARSSIADEHVGPLLLKAQLSYELHRLRPALDALKAPQEQAEYFHDQAQLSEITSLRGAITCQLGDYDTGIAMLKKSIALGPSAGHKQRLAIALAKVGGDDEAQRIFKETAAVTEAPRSLAWIEMQRAKMALERGDRVAGRKHLENANELFPGFWQTEEHLAELDAQEGHTERAITAYTALVKKTNDPEFMDALAELIADRNPEEAKRLQEKSNAIYEDRLVKLPETSYGHALEHFLKLVPDPARGLAIAKKNFALRPNGEAGTRLAQAYVRAGRIAEAKTEIMKVLATKWVWSETYATAAVIFRLANDAGAKAMEEKAHARNPHALEEIAWLKPVPTA